MQCVDQAQRNIRLHDDFLDVEIIRANKSTEPTPLSHNSSCTLCSRFILVTSLRFLSSSSFLACDDDCPPSFSSLSSSPDIDASSSASSSSLLLLLSTFALLPLDRYGAGWCRSSPPMIHRYRFGHVG